MVRAAEWYGNLQTAERYGKERPKEWYGKPTVSIVCSIQNSTKDNVDPFYPLSVPYFSKHPPKCPPISNFARPFNPEYVNKSIGLANRWPSSISPFSKPG